ncbi:putative ribosome-binding factor A, mitochondrial isoform X5 [Larus michahellis]|uniref:putative ribosome-binding factor A, mitochondrial isoform X5 n=1 Tax=Larus michahellis TaxID=119627 RepID=UPI003D9B92A0
MALASKVPERIGILRCPWHQTFQHVVCTGILLPLRRKTVILKLYCRRVLHVYGTAMGQTTRPLHKFTAMYLLMSQQILGNVPPIVFVKDKEAAVVKEIEELLSRADFGPPEEEEISQNDSSELVSSTTQSSDSPMRSNLFGIDHELLNKQIMDYKRLKVSRDIESAAWTEEQEQQLSKIKKKIKKKKPRNPPDDDITPQKYLLDRYEADYWNDNTESVSDYELEDELQEETGQQFQGKPDIMKELIIHGCTVEEKKENALQTAAFIQLPCSLFKKMKNFSE